jgi:hypothetical protein
LNNATKQNILYIGKKKLVNFKVDDETVTDVVTAVPVLTAVFI